MKNNLGTSKWRERRGRTGDEIRSKLKRISCPPKEKEICCEQQSEKKIPLGDATTCKNLLFGVEEEWGGRGAHLAKTTPYQTGVSSNNWRGADEEARQ